MAWTIVLDIDIADSIYHGTQRNMEGRSLKLIKIMNSEKMHHTSPLWTSYGASFLSFLGANYQGAVSIRKTVLPGMAIPMLKIRRPNGRLIFNMEIAIRR